MWTVTAEFDGRAFVPMEKINLPPGTRVEVLVPGSVRQPTEQDKREWEEILQEIRANAPAFPTVEEALRHTRKRP